MAAINRSGSDSLDYERIGRFIYSFHRVCGSVDALTEIAQATNVPPALAKRVESLAKKFHNIMQPPASTTESEFESTLREASDVQSAINEWRNSGSLL